MSTDDALRFAPHNQQVHPLTTFDQPVCFLVQRPWAADLSRAKWLLAKRLAGHSCKLAWDDAKRLILGCTDGSEDQRVALRDFFIELEGQEIAAVMRAAGATPRRMAALFHAIGVRQWQAVLWVNQYSSCDETPEMRYWDGFVLGSLKFVDGKLMPRNYIPALDRRRR